MRYVEGNLMASQKIEIHSTSKVVGNIKSPALNIELGGVFDGTCDMTGKETKIIPLVKSEEIQLNVVNQVLVKNEWISVDPYMRARMTDRKNYKPPFEINKPMEGAAIGKIIESNSSASKIAGSEA